MSKNNKSVENIKGLVVEEELNQATSVTEEEIAADNVNVAQSTVANIAMFDPTLARKPRVNSTKSSKGGFTIVNTEENGKRVSIAGGVLKGIGISNEKGQKLEIGILKDGVVIAKAMSGVGAEFTLMKRVNVYSASLVDDITNTFKIDFSEVTSRSFNDLTYQNLEGGGTVAMVKL